MYGKIVLFFGVVSSTYAVDTPASEDVGNFWIWIALFALAFVGIVILFISSRQMMKIQKIHKEMFHKQLDLEQKQARFLADMSENIHGMTQEVLKKSHTDTRKMPLKQRKTDDASKIEDALLDTTNDLIEFLRLKSKKVEILDEEFNINNVLNEVSGTICTHFNGSEVELIFDINNNVPRVLVGDSLHLGQILHNILENMMEDLTDEELQLKIAMFNTSEEKIELQFQIMDKGPGKSREEMEVLFNPQYDDNTGQYTGLGLFVAKELIEMMHGELTVQSDLGKGTAYTLTLPFKQADVKNQRKYRLPERVLTDKKVLIVDSNYNSALSIKKMFAYFKHNVKVLDKDKFMRSMPKMDSYDIIVLDEGLLNIRTIQYLKQIKEKKELKVISLNSLLRVAQSSVMDDVVDKIMLKPLNQERIFEMITTMYEIKVDADYEDDKVTGSGKSKIFKSPIVETKDIKQQNFASFKNKHILIVEDNMINQKVLANLLQPAGVDVTVANNGKEAVEIVKKENTETFDLVLMDINMPVMDGYAATQAIRYEQRFDSLPIIAFTALVMESEIHKMFSSGVNAFLSKPLNIGKLYTALAMFLLEDPLEAEENVGTDTKNISSLPGLNVEEGIKHSNNSKALYMEILKEFDEAYGKSDQVFTNLVKEHRFEQLKMLCLDMKGLSGAIGATEMNKNIEEIHKILLYKKFELLPGYIETYNKELSTLIQSLHLYLKS